MGYVVIAFIVCMALIKLIRVLNNKEEEEKKDTYTVTQTKYNGVDCNDDGKCYFINSRNASKCAFCDSKKIVAGAWEIASTLTKGDRLGCKDCGAAYLYGVWLLPKKTK